MLYLLLAILIIAGLVMFLKKVLHLTVDDEDYSEEDDYLERRIKSDEDK